MRLTNLRKAIGITISSVAKKLNISSACVCQWEKGKRLPAINQIPKLAKILGCTIEDVVQCFCD